VSSAVQFEWTNEEDEKKVKHTLSPGLHILGVFLSFLGLIFPCIVAGGRMITFERTVIFYLCDGNLALHEFFISMTIGNV
jgi:hypothetical protein